MRCYSKFFSLVAVLIVLLLFCANTHADSLLNISNLRYDTVNVKRFGALGDGKSDDTKAFRRAASALKGDNMMLYIPEGVYRLSSKIEILKSNVKIKGAGNVVLQFTNENCRIDKRGYCYCDLGLHIGKNLSNIWIDGLKLYGHTNESIISYGITVWDFSKHITISNCILNGFTGGILFNRRNSDIVCESNVFRNMIFVPAVTAGGYGIVFQSSENTIVRKNVFESSIYRHALYYARNQKYPQESGSQHQFFDNTVYGSVQRNYLTGYELSFKILGNSNIRIEKNRFIGGIGHIWLVKNKTGIHRDPMNVTIRGNVFKNIARNKSSSHVYAIGADDLAKTDGLNIRDNIFDNNNVSCLIKLQYGENLLIQDNKVNSINMGHFLFVEYYVNNLRILNNEVNVMNDNFYGIIIGEAHSKATTTVTMENNIIRGSDIGLLIRSNVLGEIRNNSIYAKSSGISLPGTKFKGNILGNKFFRSKQAIQNSEGVIRKQLYSGNFFNGKEM